MRYRRRRSPGPRSAGKRTFGPALPRIPQPILPGRYRRGQEARGRTGSGPALVAGLQTAWVHTGKPEYLRATRFWGKAPLAIEGLLASFLESTFLRLWIFGWDRLPNMCTSRRSGSRRSAPCCRRTSSSRRTPGCSTRSYRVDTEAGRAELTDFPAVLTNSTAVVTFAHTVTAYFLTAGAPMLAISAWQMRRRSQPEVFRPALRWGLEVVLVAGLGRLLDAHNLRFVLVWGSVVITAILGLVTAIVAGVLPLLLQEIGVGNEPTPPGSR